MVSVCAGLVIVDQESQVIRLVHYTTQDYFQRLRSEIFPTIQLNIAKTCLTYLGFDDFDSDQFTQEFGGIDKLQFSFPFLDYAGKHWGHHARGMEEPVKELVNRLMTHPVNLELACHFIDESGVGLRRFGPMKPLTILVHFRLEHLIRSTADLPDITCAIRYRRDTSVFFLVENGNCWHDSGRYTPNADISSHRLEGNENIVRLLASKGVRIDLGVDNGNLILISALLKYARDERGQVPALLLEFGAMINPEKFICYTPLMRAVVEGDEFDVWQVLNAGVNVNEKDQRGRDALIYAALARHETVIGQLLEAGADVNSQDEDDMTALCAVCKGGNEKIVKHLLKSGADISAQDRFGETATSIATESGHTSILRLLNNEGTDGDSEDETTANIGMVDEYSLNKIITLFKDDDGTSENRYVESVRRLASRWWYGRGYNKTIPPLLDALFKERAEEGGSVSPLDMYNYLVQHLGGTVTDGGH